jgi:hypothetical protein
MDTVSMATEQQSILHEDTQNKTVWLVRMPSFGILRRVALITAGVSEELSASTNRVTRIGEQETADSCHLDDGGPNSS